MIKLQRVRGRSLGRLLDVGREGSTVCDGLSDTIKPRPPFSILGRYVVHRQKRQVQNVESAQRVEKKPEAALDPFRSRTVSLKACVVSERLKGSSASPRAALQGPPSSSLVVNETRAETNGSSHSRGHGRRWDMIHNRLPIKVRSVRKAPLHADTQETIHSGTEVLN